MYQARVGPLWTRLLLGGLLAGLLGLCVIRQLTFGLQQQLQDTGNASIGIHQQLPESTIHLNDGSKSGHQAQLVAAGSAQTSSLASRMLQTFIRTNDMRAYHQDLHSYRPEAKLWGDPSYIQPDNPQHLARCAQHLNQYQLLLKSFIELDPVLDNASLDSLRLADVFGRPEAGILSGNQYWLGSYSGCLGFEHKPAPVQSEPIKAHYCLGITQYPNWNPQDGLTSVKVGLCLPETCTSSMLNENAHLLQQVEEMMKYQFGAWRAFNKLKLREVYCLPHETSQVRRYSTSALVFFLVVGSFILISLLATAFDHMTSKLPVDAGTKVLTASEPLRLRKSKRQVMIEAFSLSRNLEKLLSTGRHEKNDKKSLDQANQNLNESVDDRELSAPDFDKQTFLNSTTGLKCIGLFWIICAHTFLVGPITASNMIDMDKLTKTYLADLYLTAHLIVDTFFAISGLLAAYFIFSGDISKIKNKHWIMLTVHRYWRLSPIYLLNYWFTKEVGYQINSGPMWDYATSENSPRLNCAKESWLVALFHLSDFKSPKEHCVPFAWFIANGIKFWMVTPFILVLIHKSIRRGYMVTIGAIAANIVLVTYLALQSNVDMKSVIEFKPESANNMLNHMGEVYTRPYSRIGTYLIGLLAGHLMYLVETNKLEVKLSKNANIVIWTLSSVTVIVLTFMLRIAGGIELEEAAIPWIFALSAGLVRPLWALCTCWFVFAMAIGQIKWMSRFLSADFWRVLVKLGFTGYLVQGEVIAQLFLSTDSTKPFTYKDMISLSIVTIVLTMFVSTLIVLFIEYPLIGIEQLILPKEPPRSCSEAREEQERNGKGIGNGGSLSNSQLPYDKSKYSKLKSS